MTDFNNTHIKTARNSIEKLAYVHRARFPGPKAHHVAIAMMIDAFSNNSMDVSLLLRRYDKGLTDKIKDYFGLSKDLNIKTLFSLSFLPVSLDFVYKRSLGREISELCERYGERAAVYYRYSAVSGRVMANYVCKSGIPFFCEVHVPLKSAAQEINFLKKMRGVIAITETLRRQLIDVGLEPEKVLTAPSGVNFGTYEEKRRVSKQHIRKELSLPLEKSLVVYTGKPYEGRGVETLIESAKFLDDSALVLIVGGLPEDLKRLGAIVQNNNLQNRVKLEGHKPSYQIPSYQMGADVLIMPYSKDWNLQQSASPIKMIEYMASGNPIVSSDFPVIREVLSEENSVLVPPDDTRLLAEGIKKCLSDSRFVSSITENALNLARSNSWDNRAVKIKNFMDSLL
ncbi:glycosyltransferase [Candidatus Mycalebacterium sp.]